MAVTNLLKLIF